MFSIVLREIICETILVNWVYRSLYRGFCENERISDTRGACVGIHEKMKKNGDEAWKESNLYKFGCTHLIVNFFP